MVSCIFISFFLSHFITVWHLVWTGDGRVFFFSPSTKTSIWERPKELEDNLTIDELLNMGPPSKDEKQDDDKLLEKEAEPMEIGLIIFYPPLSSYRYQRHLFKLLNFFPKYL